MDRAHERDLLADAALAAAAYAPWASDWPISGLLACVGSKHDGRLMVYGRATNGWITGWSPDQLKSPADAAAFAKAALDGVQQSNGNSGPMEWVARQWGNDDEYNPARSAFWRVAREVHAGIASNSDEPINWSDHLVWSNLYKLANEKEGNPSETLCRLQFGTCLSLFRTELDLWRPRNVLILAGWDWAGPFITPVCQWSRGPGEIEAIAHYHHDDGTQSKIVVAPHPQGRAESPVAQEAIAAFSDA